MGDSRTEVIGPVSSDAQPEPAVTIIRPLGRWPGLGLSELWRYRSICMVLVRRNLKVRYRQTVMGAGWSILQPILLMLVFTVFFGLLARMPSQGVPFPVFFLTGIVMWHAAARVLSQGTASIVSNSALVERVYFPRVYFPLAATLVGLADLLFGLVALAVVLLIFQVIPGWEVLLVPLLVGIGFGTVLGVVLWLSALNAAYRDVSQMLPFLTQMWFFSSPILYPSTIVPESMRALYYLNPMALVITGFRWAFAGTPAPPPEAWVISSGVALLLLVSGYVFFRYRERTFADVL